MNKEEHSGVMSGTYDDAVLTTLLRMIEVRNTTN